MNATQTDFRAAVFDPNSAIPAGLIDGANRAAGKRFDVYRNNVVMSLKEALTESFPVITKLLGTQNFSSLAGLYVRAHPPADPRMMFYGATFPTFLDNLDALSHLPYLPDVARLELAQRQSYHAADAEPIDPVIFGQLSADRLANSRLEFAPSVRITRSSWPILEIWHFNMTDGAPLPSANAQDVLIARPEFDPVMDVLGTGSADLINALMQGAQLGVALDEIEKQHPDFDFPTTLGLLIRTGAITRLTPDT